MFFAALIIVMQMSIFIMNLGYSLSIENACLQLLPVHPLLRPMNPSDVKPPIVDITVFMIWNKLFNFL